MAVITMFRQAGDGGRYIAENLAQALGYNFSDYKTAERLLEQEGFAQAPQVLQSVTDFWDRFTRAGQERNEINARLRSYIRATARHGNVVMLGRGFFASLQGLSDVLNVRLKAPLSFRINRIMQLHQMTHDEAATYVKEKDVLVADFARNSHGLSPDDLALFDLVIDTGKVPLDSAVRILVEAVGAMTGAHAEGPTAATLKVDPVMVREVSDEFERIARLHAQADR